MGLVVAGVCGVGALVLRVGSADCVLLPPWLVAAIRVPDGDFGVGVCGSGGRGAGDYAVDGELSGGEGGAGESREVVAQ